MICVLDKEKLLESLTDEEIIEILVELGCNNYKEYRDYIAFSTNVCHDGNHLNLIYFRDSKLLRCFSECQHTYSLYTLIQKVKDIKFYEAVKYVSDFVGRVYQELDDNIEKITDWEFINKYKKIKRKKFNEELNYYSEHVLENYILEPNIDFYNDGIDFETQKEFGIRYSIQDKRIIIPIYNETGLVGIKGRILKKYENENEKYLAILPYKKNLVLYGLNKTLPYILNSGEIIVYESEKSVMKSWQYNFKNCVALGGLNLSDWQFKRIISLAKEVTIALDEGVNNEYYKELIKKFKPFIQINIIYDTKGLIEKGSKLSPVDKGKDIFISLYNNKYKIRGD